MKTFTKPCRRPSSVISRSSKPGCRASSETSTAARSAPSTVSSPTPPVRERKVLGIRTSATSDDPRSANPRPTGDPGPLRNPRPLPSGHDLRPSGRTAASAPARRRSMIHRTPAPMAAMVASARIERGSASRSVFKIDSMLSPRAGTPIARRLANAHAKAAAWSASVRRPKARRASARHGGSQGHAREIPSKSFGLA